MLQPGNPQQNDGRLGLIPVVLSYKTIAQVSTIQLNLPNHHRDAETPKVVEAMYMALMQRFEYGAKFNTLHPIEEMEIEYDQTQDKVDIKELVKAQEKVKEKLASPEFESVQTGQVQNFEARKSLISEIEELRQTIGKASEMIMSTELVSMKRVMRRLDMVDKNDVPHLKGKVAAGISAADELLTTELIFSGFFQELDPHQMTAVLSCLVYTDSKSEGKPPKDAKL